jgi:DNA-binding FadR family transcriptional regulator
MLMSTFMELDRIQSTASHLAVADSVRRWIALGVLGPGDRLPAERELAERLGVGRMTVRQAVRVLADEGLVSTQRGRAGGTFVLDDPERPFPSGEVTEQMMAALAENYEFRAGIEPLAARLAAERAEDNERWAIRGLAEGEPSSVRAFRALDSRFHLAVANASHNRLLADAVSRSRTELFPWADQAWESVEWTDVAADERDFGRSHRPIGEAIVNGDGAEAERRMEHHLVQGQAQFVAMIERFAGRRSKPSKRAASTEN